MASVPRVAEGYRPVTTADLAPGGTRCVDVDGVGVIVARGQDGQYYAVERLCSHAALPLDGGRVRGASIVCPHHGARFDLKSGRVLGPPAYAAIAAFPTRERCGQVEVWIYS
ncbi:MAG TPA: Rieske (2Fe-2S) protein [Sphingomonas sp.]|nr:Rieske (2Fe-2S) protein [Sphingomonas sp.]